MLLTTDINELKKRITITDCSITKVKGVYINANGDKEMYMSERLLSLPKEQIEKYLGIANTIFNKKVNDNMLSLKFDEYGEETKELLNRIVQDELVDDEDLDKLYDRIISTYQGYGNCLVLVFHDTYDIMKIAKDGTKLEESEECYKHIICAICPVVLTPPELEYKEKEKKITNRERNWVVQPPMVGFIYPALEERTVEKEKIMYYEKHADNPHHIFMEDGLSCLPVMTITQIRNKFEDIVYEATASKNIADRCLMRINERINAMLLDVKNPEKTLTGEELMDICKASAIDETYANKIVNYYDMEFNNEDYEYPKAAFLLNKRLLKKNEENKKKEALLIMLSKAVNEIEGPQGAETELTADIKTVIARNIM